MHIFKHTNYDFLRWRWHAIALSWVIIIAGVQAMTFVSDAASKIVSSVMGSDFGTKAR